jgi:tetratricopeptide (TPR) repeat protein
VLTSIGLRPGRLDPDPEIVRASSVGARLQSVVAFAVTNPGGVKDEHRGERRRSKVVKGGIAVSVVLLLLYLGFHGRRYARLQARLSGVTAIRDQLQQRLEQQPGSIQHDLEGSRGTNANASSALSTDAEVQAIVRALKERIDQFESVYSPGNLPQAESLELRLNKATMANAEGRYADALAVLPDVEEKEKGAGAAGRTSRWTDMLEVRGDAFYGLHQWQNALDRYQQLLMQQPNRLAVLERVAACQYATGKREEAVKWQEKAIELAPTQKQAALRSRLEIYKSTQP